MAIKTKYNFKGIEVKDAVIKVNRLFGSKQEGWNSLVGVYNVTLEDEKEVYNLIEEFNHSASYATDERGYVSIYKSLTEKFGGIEI